MMGVEDQKRDLSAGTGEVDGRLFRIAHAFVGHDLTRDYIRGVIVEPREKGVWIVATNGHAMLLIADESGRISRPATIRLPKYARALLRRPSRLTLTLAKDGKGTEATVLRTRGSHPDRLLATVHDVEIGGILLGWRKIPSKVAEAGEGAQFAPTLLANRYVADFAKAARRFHKANFSNLGHQGVSIRPHGIEVNVIGFEAGVPAVGFLMPCVARVKGEFQLPTLPDWLASFAPADPTPAA